MIPKLCIPVEKSDYLDIKIEEFAPKCFAYLRELEDINIDDDMQNFRIEKIIGIWYHNI